MEKRLLRRNGDSIERVCHYGHENRCYDCADRTKCNADIFDRLAHYEDLEEQGRLVELPVGVGQIVWFTVYGNIPTATVVYKASYVLQSDGIHAYYETEDSCGNTDYFHGEAIGKTVFRSRPEAEAALAASGKEG